MIFRRPSFLFLILILRAGLSFAKAPMVYLYHPPESNTDVRYNYHWEILKASLEVTKKQYGPYEFTPTANMTEDRQVVELLKPDGTLKIMIREASIENEKRFLPIRIPIDRNIIGYRVFLIHKNKKELFAKIKSLADLKKLLLGQGKGWGDVLILREAGFNVRTVVHYEKLFSLLHLGEFDGFPRGLSEVQGELNQFKKLYPELMIEENTVLYYPLPTYFWFQKNEEGKKLAERVEIGMNIIMQNGTFDKIFNSHYKELIAELDLKNRTVFRIKNSFLPPETPFENKSLWYDPTK